MSFYVIAIIFISAVMTVTDILFVIFSKAASSAAQPDSTPTDDDRPNKKPDDKDAWKKFLVDLFVGISFSVITGAIVYTAVMYFFPDLGGGPNGGDGGPNGGGDLPPSPGRSPLEQVTKVDSPWPMENGVSLEQVLAQEPLSPIEKTFALETALEIEPLLVISETVDLEQVRAYPLILGNLDSTNLANLSDLKELTIENPCGSIDSVDSTDSSNLSPPKNGSSIIN